MELESGQRLLFIGDSITDCGRARPVGRSGSLGEGYVQLVESLIAVEYPERSIEILNTGISGNRVTDLEGRWQEAVIALEPNWLSIMIGINDVWRQFLDPSNPDQVTLEYYESALRKLVADTQPSLDGLILMTPFFIESDLSDPMRAMMDKYGQIVCRLADEFGAHFVDTQRAFDRYLAERPATTLCEDRVHPNQIGHMILAKAFLGSIS